MRPGSFEREWYVNEKGKGERCVRADIKRMISEGIRYIENNKREWQKLYTLGELYSSYYKLTTP